MSNEMTPNYCLLAVIGRGFRQTKINEKLERHECRVEAAHEKRKDAQLSG
jgi:hypothetical protein